MLDFYTASFIFLESVYYSYLNINAISKELLDKKAAKDSFLQSNLTCVGY